MAVIFTDLSQDTHVRQLSYNTLQLLEIGIQN